MDLIDRDVIKSLGGKCIASRDEKTDELLPIISIDALPSVMPVRDCKGCRFKFLPERTEEAEIAH